LIRIGSGCRDCGYEKAGNKNRTPFEEIEEIVSKTSYVLVSKTRTAHNEKVILKCEIHGEFPISLDRLKEGQGCFKCGHAKGRIKTRISHEDFCKRISHFGYDVLTSYVTSHTYVTVKCPKHGEFTSIAYSLMQGHGCSACASRDSKSEIELFEKMRSFYPSAKKLRSRVFIEDRPYIKRFEIDIFIPELNLGIEFDGEYYHSFEKMRADYNKRFWSDDDIRNYHQIKDNWFLSSKDIKILHIKWKDWDTNKEACIKRCLDFLASK
jgi:hypothetical protein